MMRVIGQSIGVLAVLGAAAAGQETVRLVDVTGDGRPDRLGLGADGAVTVAVYDGGRRFRPIIQELPRVVVTDILVTDLQRDGHPDLYLVGPAANSALLGDGSGRFWDATDALGLHDAGTGLFAEQVDFDGDARPEILLHNADGDVLFWAQADGSYDRDVENGSSRDAAGGFASASAPGGPWTTGGTSGGGPGSGPTPGVGSGAGGLGISGRPKRRPGQPPLPMVTPEQQDILNHMSIVYIEDDQAIPYKTIRIEGVNVQIVNGLGATNGDPFDPMATSGATNGLGNLIVGYNDPRLPSPPPFPAPAGNDYRGSHNIVLGARNNYERFGGIVGGLRNEISGAHASVLTGEDNTASGHWGVVAAGELNTASGANSFVAAGNGNRASGTGAAVVSGLESLASGAWAFVGTGESCTASGTLAAVVGGSTNQAKNSWDAVLGGIFNVANGPYAAVAGGNQNTASGQESAVLGGFFNQSSGRMSACMGGQQNIASADYTTVSGGSTRSATAADDWVAGTLWQND